MTTEKPNAGGSPANYTIERLGSLQQLLALREAWEALAAEIAGCSFFLSWAWVSTWWPNLHADNELWLLTAKNREGELAGLAPLMCGYHRIGFLTSRRLRFIGSGLARPVHLDFLARDEERESVAAAFLHYLSAHGREWDLLDLQGLCENSPLIEQMAGIGGRFLVRAPEKCSFTSLPDSWETFQSKHLKPKLLKTIRYYRRRLEKDFPGQVVFQAVASEPELQQALDFLVHNSQRLARQKGMVSCFAEDHFCRFYQQIVLTAFRRGLLRFYQLKVDGRIIAVQHCFYFQGRFYGYQTAYDSDWRQYSPGQQLLAHLYQEAVREKAEEVDMTHGGDDYKASWANGERFDWQLLYARNLRARWRLFGLRAFDRLMAGGRKLLPVRVRRRMNRLLQKRGFGIHSGEV